MFNIFFIINNYIINESNIKAVKRLVQKSNIKGEIGWSPAVIPFNDAITGKTKIFILK